VCACVCSDWYHFSEDGEVWKKLCIQKWGGVHWSPNPNVQEYSAGFKWKTYFSSRTQTIHLFINSDHLKNTLTIHVKRCQLIETIKNLIEVKEGIPANTISLFLSQGKEVKDAFCVDDYDIHDGSTLLLRRKL